MVDLTAGDCWQLNRVGTAIWGELDGRATLADVASRVSAAYSPSPKTIVSDVLTLASNLLQAGLVQQIRPEVSAADFGEKFALSLGRDGGVLLDLRAGDYFRLNHSAALLCEELVRHARVDDALCSVADRTGWSLADAAERVKVFLLEFQKTKSVRHSPIGPFRYVQVGSDYELHHEGRPILRVDAGGTALCLLSKPEELQFQLLVYIRALAVKILCLQGFIVVHGASCLWQSRLVAFCGESGAGKTTTARAYAAHGASLVSEDLLLISPDLDSPAAFANGEAAVHSWASKTDQILRSDPSRKVATNDLVAAASGSTLPIGEIWFLDRSRRVDILKIDLQDDLQRTTSLLESTFLGTATPEGWRRLLQESAQLASNLRGYTAWLPTGVKPLEDALASYMAMSTS